MSIRLSLETKIAAGFGLALGVLIGMGLLSIFNTSRLAETVSTASYTDRASARLDRLMLRLLEAQSCANEFAITGVPKALASYEPAKSAIAAELKLLQPAAEDAAARADCTALESLVRSELTEMDNLVQTRREQGLDAAVALIHANQSDRGTERIRRRVVSIQQQQQALLMAHQHQASALAHQTMATITCGSVVAVGLLTLAGLIIRRDLIARKRAEEQMRQAQRMQAASFLAGGAAHYFNNLMTAVIGNVELLLLQMHDRPEAKQLNEIHKAGERAVTLTEQLLAYSRRQFMQARPFDLNELLADMTPLLRAMAGPTIEFSILSDPKLEPVYSDPRQIEQVIRNLVANARDAMPNGGKLTVATAGIQLNEAYTSERLDVKPGRYGRLTITDTGTGMSPEIKSHAFEPFFTTQGFAKATGLGLATAYGIVKQSGGHIEIDSEIGKGTTFVVYLPRAADVKTGAHETRVT